ncbi:hypothetical protein [Prosthecobacter sp.]|uniref:hypothetical protein n=1 Tax=Prosthecobacter sp. TaxID=1965333 RepID=UPI0037843528
MFTRPAIVLTCLLSIQGITQAHMNPHGDVSPGVEVENGNFSIDFITRVEGEILNWNMVFSPEGKLLLPRHRVYIKRPQQPAPAEVVKVETSDEPGSSRSRFVLTRILGGQKTEQPLPLDPVKFASVAESSSTAQWTGFTWTSFGFDPFEDAERANKPYAVHLMFSTAALQGFAPGKTVLLGEPATIYDFPTASPPVWAARRWWVAWVRQAETAAERKDPLRRWETILTSIDPVSGKVEHKHVTGLSHWNTNVSMKTTGGWLCIAWNATIDGSYPGVAKIVTAFEKLPQE